jgi:hypothetical protein
VTHRSRRPRHARRRRRSVKTWLRRVGVGAAGAFLIWFASQFFAPPVNQAGLNVGQRLASYVIGEDKPIELKPLCDKQGGIVAPPAEKDAAYHWRCRRSTRLITREQIAERCAAQWGNEAKLALREPDESSGWKCHFRGLLR